MSEYTQYEHHGRYVWVDTELKGRHRAHCLCFSCDKFTPDDREANCPIASGLYVIACEHGIVSPVYECPKFAPKEDHDA